MPTVPTLRTPITRDPAWQGRVFWIIAALVLLWPMLVTAEFKPWILFEASNLKPTLKFLGDFFPPKLDAEFLQMVVKETWRTVAMATAGITLALVIAIPLALLAVRVLSISALPGRMALLPASVRQCVRWVLIILRSVPELIWALVFVRVVGLGPTAGVLAIALTYGGMLGKVYAEILESGESDTTRSLLRNGAGRLQAFVGAGGLGQQMDASMKMFNGSEVSTMLIVFMLLVWLADWVSAWLRKSLG
jgi:phosphonate transport system permease protein